MSKIKAMHAKIPELRFPGFEGAWEEKKLGAICEKAKSGGTPISTSREYYDGNIPFLSITDMTKSGKYISKTDKYISEKGLENSSAWVVPKDSLIYSMYASVGFVAINKIPLATSQAMINLIPNTKVVKLGYLYYHLLNYKKYVHRFIETGTQGNLNAQIVKGFDIPLPSTPEQQKIAGFLGSVDEWVKNLKKQKENLEAYKKGLMQKIFPSTSSGQVPEIRFRDDSGNDFPDWEEKKLGEVVDILRGASLSKSDAVVGGKCKYIMYGELFTKYHEVINNVVSSTNSESNIKSIVGDILMPTSDVTPNGLATASTLMISDVVIGGDVNVLRAKDTINSVFLSYMINAQKKKIMRLVTGTTIKHIYAKDVKKIFYYFPSVLEQQKIAEFLTSVDTLIESKEKQISAAEEWKKGLMQRMFV